MGGWPIWGVMTLDLDLDLDQDVCITHARLKIAILDYVRPRSRSRLIFDRFSLTTSLKI